MNSLIRVANFIGYQDAQTDWILFFQLIILVSKLQYPQLLNVCRRNVINSDVVCFSRPNEIMRIRLINKEGGERL